MRLGRFGYSIGVQLKNGWASVHAVARGMSHQEAIRVIVLNVATGLSLHRSRLIACYAQSALSRFAKVINIVAINAGGLLIITGICLRDLLSCWLNVIDIL